MLALVDDANYAGTAVSGQPTATATFYPDVPVGYILMTTNGGTVWCPPTPSRLPPPATS